MPLYNPLMSLVVSKAAEIPSMADLTIITAEMVSTTTILRYLPSHLWIVSSSYSLKHVHTILSTAAAGGSQLASVDPTTASEAASTTVLVVSFMAWRYQS